MYVRDTNNDTLWIVTAKRGDMIWLAPADKWDNNVAGSHGLHRNYWNRLTEEMNR
jgi:hypothetical protein